MAELSFQPLLPSLLSLMRQHPTPEAHDVHFHSCLVTTIWKTEQGKGPAQGPLHPSAGGLPWESERAERGGRRAVVVMRRARSPGLAPSPWA